MSTNAAIDHNQPEYFTRVFQAPFKYIIKNLDCQAAALWVNMLMTGETFNHYPQNLARDFGTSLRTMQRRLNQLMKIGALRKITRKSTNGRQCVYYRAVEIPTQYRRDQALTADIPKNPSPPPKSVNDAKPVEKPKPAPTTNLTHLTTIKIKNNTNNNITRPALTTKTRQTVDNRESGTGKIREYFEQLAFHYPEHKVPHDNQNYLNSCFNQFKICTSGMNFDQIELFTGFLINDVKLRKRKSPHWLIGNIPQLFGYLHEKRWQMPIGEPVEFEDHFHESPRIAAAVERYRDVTAMSGRALGIAYVDLKSYQAAAQRRLTDAVYESKIGEGN
jgi:hypothetical protein